jgi:peptidoglycan/xylan/chitin deacetylase (PgdA/CDA1 family)
MLNLITRRLSRGKVTVLLFHKVPVTVDPVAPHEADLPAFERVLDFLCERYRVIPLQDALRGLDDATGRSIPGGSVCLTFDDGYVEWASGLAAALERRQAHATFYMTTGQYDDMPLWHERIRHAVQRATHPIMDVISHPLTVETDAARCKAVAVLEHTLKYMPLAERAERLLHLEQVTASDPLTIPRMSQALTRDLSNRGFAIGAHTVDHPILSLTTEREAMHELGTARETLEAITGARIDMLAYPNGRMNDFKRTHVDMARRAGYTSAVTTEPGTICTNTDRFLIPRFTPWGPDPLRMQVQMARNLLRPSMTSQDLA